MAFGFGRNKKGDGWGRKGFAAGPPTNCICPNCKTVVPHKPGLPCFQTKCPKCNSGMTRQFSDEK